MSEKQNSAATKILRSRIVTISAEPELGMLTMQTDAEPVRLLIDAQGAEELIEECMKLLGFPSTMDVEP